MKRKMPMILIIVLLTIISGCFVNSVALYEGSHKGKIVDADTGEPLEGVVVLGVWYTETPSVGGGVTKYYDARETVTDKEGRFSVPGLGVRIVINLVPMMDTVIFKAGYGYLQFFWDKESLNDERACGVKVTWDGKIPVVPLRKLSPEERRRKKYIIPPGPPSDAPYEKVKHYLKELDKDAIERGIEPRKEWGGVKYEVE